DAKIFSLFEKTANKHFWFHGRKSLIYNFMKRFFTKNINMLEIGSGVGDVAGYLSKKSIDIEIADIYLDVLKMSKEKYGFPCYQLDIEHLPFKEHYDTIGIFDVLEHINQEQNVLENIHGALKKDGLLIITVPAFGFLWSYWDTVNKHKRRYTKNMLKKRLENAGFTIERTSYMFFLLSPFTIMSRLLKKNIKEDQDSLFEKELKIVPILNTLFYYLIKLESYLLKYFNLPFGTSVIAVARKI
ncbi:class I SAM-dependent methyltransferase, partial [bacterium]|nr:class I SAM-dependent methyltransferase [bacterium]